MEAVVLMPDVRAELEVQKLQKLVRKLERQNEQLRSRANIATPAPACLLASSCCVPSPVPNLACQCFPPEEPFPYFQPHSAAEDDEDEEPLALLDQLEILDLETLIPQSESDETWCLWSGEGLSALDWSRQVLDQQRSVKKWRSSFSSPCSPSVPRARVVGVSPLCVTPNSSSRTCERAGGGVRRSVSADVSDVSVDSVPLGYKLQDLMDVQVMARLQEESLRQDFVTTSSAHSRRSASFSFQRGESQPDEEDDDEDCAQLPPPQPRLSRAGPLRRGLTHSHTFSGVRDWTTLSYPPISPIQGQTGVRNTSETLRRSMPNLLKSLSVSIPANQTSPSIRNSQSFDSSSALGRLQSCIPSPGQLQNRVQSVGNFSSRQPLKATAYVSPTVKGPSPMTSSTSLQSLSTSGIPQPSKTSSSGSQIPSRSALPRPASFIATGSTPRSKLSTPARRTEFWKSQPRKFCQYCKCWIADNKPSVQFHERGKNHKENVAAKIEDIKKKSIAKAKQDEKTSKQFAAMEEAALKAYEDDLKRLNNPSEESLPASSPPVKPQTKSNKREVKVKLKAKGKMKASRNKPADVWLEGRTHEESQWQKPGVFQGDSTSGQAQGSSGGVWIEADGSPPEETQGEAAAPQAESLSTDEEKSEPPKETTEEEVAESKQSKVPKINFRKRKAEQSETSGEDGGQKASDEGGDEEVKEADSCVTQTPPAVQNRETSVRRSRPVNPYGAWEKIQPPQDPYEKVDLQLPHAHTADATPVLPPEPKSRFKERTITSLGDESNAGSTFNKRKTENGKSRSLRARENDD
ncbi:SLAIN motif-containing protein 1 [Triplophysa tibetana]|uniref:SLAIN motif-containing protein 1 n=1 Tax=Triplophysa tibetana TaxID=1572043 RepID=A0A5A9NV46_9TELE|nr:SLAIN motif-containing protein 1 [Triplophysa tibetana]